MTKRTLKHLDEVGDSAEAAKDIIAVFGHPETDYPDCFDQLVSAISKRIERLVEARAERVL